MGDNLRISDIFNLILGGLSILGIITGFFLEQFRIIFWVISITLLIFVVIGYYVADNRYKIIVLSSKMKKIEESLNIYDRLNKLELMMKMRKRGEIDLLDIIKIGLAVLLIYVFIKAILSIAGS